MAMRAWQSDQAERMAIERKWRTMFVIRWVFVALTSAIAIALLARGELLLGLLFAALSCARVVRLVTVSRLRQRRGRVIDR